MNMLKRLSPRTRFCVLFGAYIITICAGTFAIHATLQRVIPEDTVGTFNNQVGEMVGGLVVSSVSFYRQAYTDFSNQLQRMRDMDENMKRMR